MEKLNLSDQNGNGVRSPTLRDLLAIAFRHRRLTVISFLAIVSGAILAAGLQPDRFEAGMKILVKRERVVPVVTPEASSMWRLQRSQSCLLSLRITALYRCLSARFWLPSQAWYWLSVRNTWILHS
jgi:uncharacterized protein involved in exopolysaccharide biosynthesis